MNPPDATIGAVFLRHVSVWENGRVGELKSIIDDDYMGHTSAGERDADGLRKRIEAFRSSFRDIHFSIRDQVIDGDKVATRLECTAVENATNRAVHMWGMNLSVVRKGLIVEEWAVWETAYNGAS